MEKGDNYHLVRALWKQGLVDADIARHLGISRERVRQLRGGLSREWERVGKVAFTLKVSESTIKSWVDKKKLSTSPSGLVRPEDVEIVYASIWNRTCEYPGCTNAVESISEQTKYCPPDREKVRNYAYPTMDKLSKDLHKTAVARWRLRNPERAAKAQREASQAYRDRQKVGA